MIDVLEIASSFEDTARFGTFEVINLWDDWYLPADSTFYVEPVFSPTEQKQIAAFSKVWDEAAEVEEEQIFDSATLKSLLHWRRFRDAAETALSVFEQRGRFSEDEEQFGP